MSRLMEMPVGAFVAFTTAYTILGFGMGYIIRALRRNK